MRRQAALWMVLGTVLGCMPTAAGWGQSALEPAPVPLRASVGVGQAGVTGAGVAQARAETPAEERIRAARRQVAKSVSDATVSGSQVAAMSGPTGSEADASRTGASTTGLRHTAGQAASEARAVQASALNDLALAYLGRARELGDGGNAGCLDEAGKAIGQGLTLAPGDFGLQKTEVALLLARHRYAEAKAKATLLNRHTPDDVMTYGYIAEADLGLGDLDGADTATQWMLNMRPNNIPGLLLGARLRRLYGDGNGAVEFLKLAYAESSPTEVEELAWIVNQMASIALDKGDGESARALLDQAQRLFPEYWCTEENLARLQGLKSDGAGQAATGKGTGGAGATRVGATGLSESGAYAEPAAFGGASGAGVAVPSLVPVVPSERASSVREPVVATGLVATEAGTSSTGTSAAAIVAGFRPVAAALLTPADTAGATERRIEKAQARVTSAPKDASAYAQLGAAYFQQARESGDVAEYQMAEESLDRSLELDATDFTAEAPLETLAEVCMGEHRFADALGYAERALSLGSGEVTAFATVGDAYADMGEYAQAADAYGRLGPSDGTPQAGYARESRLAYLRFIAGDSAGAVARMRAAVVEGGEAQLPAENLAWLYYELGEFLWQTGDAAGADSAYGTALTIHPGDYRTLAALARLRANYGRYTEAIELYKRAIAVVPMPIFVSELGDVYARTGDRAQAEKQYRLVAYIGLLGHINQVLHNRDLALFYADHDMKLPEALALARRELEVRHDVYTWDALSWALYKNGKYSDALDASAKALQFGTRDALLLFHAGRIAEAAGQTERARALLEQALATNAHFHLVYSDEARRQLAMLRSQAMTGGEGGS